MPKLVKKTSRAPRFSAAAAKYDANHTVLSKTYGAQPAAIAAGSFYILKLLGITLGGWMLARSAQIATEQLAKRQGDADYLKGKVLTARFFADHLLPQASSLAFAAMHGGDSVLAVEEAQL